MRFTGCETESQAGGEGSATCQVRFRLRVSKLRDSSKSWSSPEKRLKCWRASPPRLHNFRYQDGARWISCAGCGRDDIWTDNIHSWLQYSVIPNNKHGSHVFQSHNFMSTIFSRCCLNLTLCWIERALTVQLLWTLDLVHKLQFFPLIWHRWLFSCLHQRSTNQLGTCSAVLASFQAPGSSHCWL